MSPKKKQMPSTEKCPDCSESESVGFLGGNSTRKYFCSNCCVEFSVKGKLIQIFEITSGGTIQNSSRK